MKIRDLGEFPFLRRLRDRLPDGQGVLLGVGDDCAALSLHVTTVLTTDAMVEGVHFRLAWTSFFQLGEKAFAVNRASLGQLHRTKLLDPIRGKQAHIPEFFEAFRSVCCTESSSRFFFVAVVI